MKAIISLFKKALMIFGGLFIIFIILGTILSSLDDDKKEVKNTQEKETSIQNITQNVKEINIDETKQLLKRVPKNNYMKRKELYTKLVKYDDNNTEYKEKLAFYTKKLKEVEAQSKRELAELNKQREKAILKKLKKVPTKLYATNRNLYEELVSLKPNNKRYKEKLAFYTKKLNEKKAYFGKQPVRSSWDGSYDAVKTYLKATAHDPDSIEFDNCSQVYMGAKGYLVSCVYRGKNAFGAKVRNAHWFTIRQNQVINVESANAYKLD